VSQANHGARTHFLHLGLLGFGGPVALVGQMERELLTERKWLRKSRCARAIAVCQSLPGPLAIQVGIFVAYLRVANAARGRALGIYLPNSSSSRASGALQILVENQAINSRRQIESVLDEIFLEIPTIYALRIGHCSHHGAECLRIAFVRQCGNVKARDRKHCGKDFRAGMAYIDSMPLTGYHTIMDSVNHLPA